jgi:hypothetical protein
MLALLLWAPLGGPPFPLLGSSGELLTVLGAYNLCRHKFTAAAGLRYEKTVSNDEALLEALAHAATTLASFSCGLANAKLFDFLAFLWCLLGNAQSPQDVPSLRSQASTLSKHIADHATSLASLHVPVLPPTNSSFPELLHKLDGVSVGFLERPANKEMHDGHFDDMQKMAAPRVFMECKNYKNGLYGSALENCLLPVPDYAKVFVKFTLHTQKNGYFTQEAGKHKWKTFCKSSRHPAFKNPGSELCIVELGDHTRLTSRSCPCKFVGARRSVCPTK